MLFEAASANWIFDSEYIELLVAACERAGRSILVQQFVVDARPGEDKDGLVRGILHLLAEAQSRNLDVRVLLAEILVEKPLPIDLNEPAARFLLHRGVKVRYLEHSTGGQLHAKAVIIDGKTVLCGSHNWTPGAFASNTETSIAVSSEETALVLTQRFESLWQGAKEYSHA